MTPEEFAALEERAEAAARRLPLPPCPAILARIGRELAREDPDVQRIAADAALDAASAAALLKTVNSARYGPGSKARSVQQAIAYLGLESSSLLLAGLILRNIFPSNSRPAMRGFWEESTRLALVLSNLARLLARHDADVLHTYGLFRDAGSAVLIHRFSDYEPFPPSADAAATAERIKSEQSRFGVDHAVIGAIFARDWGLPEEVCDAIRWHHVDIASEAAQRWMVYGASELIAIGILGEHLVARERGALVDDAGSRRVEDALLALKIDASRYLDIELQVLSAIGDTPGDAMQAVA